MSDDEQLSEDEQEFLDDVGDNYERKKEKQNQLKEAIADESESVIEADNVTIAGDITADVRMDTSGQFIEDMETIMLEAEDPESDMTVSGAMWELSEQLATIVQDEDYDAEFFYEVYRETSVGSLMQILERISQQVQESAAEAGKGFREDTRGQNIRNRGKIPQRRDSR